MTKLAASIVALVLSLPAACWSFSAPESGWWFNHDEPGVGLNIKMSNGVLLGAYYGYSDAGTAQWYIFSGRLEPVGATGGPVELVAPLLRFEDGACDGCPHSNPTAIDAGEMRIRFDYRNRGEYSINGKGVNAITPMIGGVDANRYFTSSDHLFPSLAGPWVITLKNENSPEPWNRAAVVVHFSGGGISFRPDGTARSVEHTILQYPFVPEISILGSLRCEEMSQEAEPVVDCLLVLSTFFPGHGNTQLLFTVDLPDIGEQRVIARGSDHGVRLQAIRLDYD
jgi:hypothetical protein